MSGTITCPKCKHPFELSESISSEIGSRLRDQFESELATRSEVIEERDLTLDERAASLDEQVTEAVGEAKSKLKAKAVKEAAEEFEVTIKDQAEKLEKAKFDLKGVREVELELLKKQRVLDEEIEQADLDVARRLKEERRKARDGAFKQFQEERQLDDAEKESVIQDLRKRVEEMKQKVEQGSQQAQGEVLEVELEGVLNQAFPSDIVEEVPKGIAGGDIVQRVCNGVGAPCGTILWESKRTKNWSKGWLAKLRKDQRDAKADVEVLVSAAMPEGVDYFELIEDVWVCHWTCACSLASALRRGILEVAKVRRVNEGRTDKADRVYSYLSSPLFRNRVGGLVESFITMKGDLDKERRAIQNQWSKREKQIEQAVSETVGMYGDFQGIVGRTLPEIEAASLGQLNGRSGAN